MNRGADVITSLGSVAEKSQSLGTISGDVTIDLSAGLSVSATVGGAVGCQARFRRGAMGHVGQCGSGGIVAPVARGVCTGGRALGVRLA